MRRVIADIVKATGCTETQASKVEDEMCVDFSECTQAQFNRDARETHAYLVMTGGV